MPDLLATRSIRKNQAFLLFYVFYLWLYISFTQSDRLDHKFGRFVHCTGFPLNVSYSSAPDANVSRRSNTSPSSSSTVLFSFSVPLLQTALHCLSRSLRRHLAVRSVFDLCAARQCHTAVGKCLCSGKKFRCPHPGVPDCLTSVDKRLRSSDHKVYQSAGKCIGSIG